MSIFVDFLSGIVRKLESLFRKSILGEQQGKISLFRSISRGELNKIKYNKISSIRRQI